MTPATFPMRSRNVRAFSQQGLPQIQGFVGGLQIRLGRFDSGTRLKHLADQALCLSTNLSTFTLRARFVHGTNLLWRMTE